VIERASVLALCLVAAAAVAAAGAKVSNTYGEATTTTDAHGVELAVAIAPAYQLPNADPFDVEIICIDASGMFKWLMTLKASGYAALNLMGYWHSASYYDIDSEVSPGLSFSLLLTPPLVNPDDRMLISIADDSIATAGPIFTVSVDSYRGQPLRMDTLRITLGRDGQGGLAVTAENLTHVPLFVPLASLVLGLAPTPDWIPDTTPDIRWVPDPPLSQEILVLGADETVTASMPLPDVPATSLTAYRGAMATYGNFVDLFSGDYLAIGFAVAWGISWGYVPMVAP
jgi:hypothetical protein